MNKKIMVLIKNDSNIILETDGFKGESCVTEIKKLMSSFIDVDNFELKSDYYDNDEELSIIEKVKL